MSLSNEPPSFSRRSDPRGVGPLPLLQFQRLAARIHVKGVCKVSLPYSRVSRSTLPLAPPEMGIVNRIVLASHRSIRTNSLALILRREHRPGQTGCPDLLGVRAVHSVRLCLNSSCLEDRPLPDKPWSHGDPCAAMAGRCLDVYARGTVGDSLRPGLGECQSASWASATLAFVEASTNCRVIPAKPR